MCLPEAGKWSAASTTRQRQVVSRGRSAARRCRRSRTRWSGYATPSGPTRPGGTRHRSAPPRRARRWSRPRCRARLRPGSGRGGCERTSCRHANGRIQSSTAASCAAPSRSRWSWTRTSRRWGSVHGCSAGLHATAGHIHRRRQDLLARLRHRWHRSCIRSSSRHTRLEQFARPLERTSVIRSTYDDGMTFWHDKKNNRVYFKTHHTRLL